MRKTRHNYGADRPRPASRQQAKNVHDQIAAAAAFLDWLTARGLTLAACTQAELDQWLAGTSGHLARPANFVRWAVARRHGSLRCMTRPDRPFPRAGGRDCDS